MSEKVLILGAGPAGLGAAYHLKGDCLVLEKEAEAGGLCRSFHIGEFIFDQALHVLYPQDSYTTVFLKSLLKSNMMQYQREAWIYHRKYRTFTRFPFQSHLYGLPKEIVEKCLAGMAAARKKEYKLGPENYLQWILRTFGQGMADEFLVPYNHKLWTVPPEMMNCAWLSDRVVAPDYCEIIRGAGPGYGKQFGVHARFWYPQAGGIGAVIKAFARKVASKVCYNSRVTNINVHKKTVTVNGKREYPWNRLVSSLPLPDLIRIIRGGVPAAVKQAARNLKFNRVFCVLVGMDNPLPADKQWIYFHDRQYLFNRVSFPMNLASGLGPKGTGSLCAEITWSAYKRVLKQNLADRVIGQLKEAGIIRNGQRIIQKKVLELDYAYVIYDRQHRKNVDLIHGFLKKHNIIPMGRFGEWEYLNMDAAILSGKRAADILNRG